MHWHSVFAFFLLILTACSAVSNASANPPPPGVAMPPPDTPFPPEAGSPPGEFILKVNPASTQEISGEVHRDRLAADLGQLAETMLAQAARQGFRSQDLPLLEKNRDFLMANDPLWGYYPWKYIQQLQIVSKNWQSGEKLPRFTILTRLVAEDGQPAGYVFSALVRPDFFSRLDNFEIKVAHIIFDAALLERLAELKQQAGYDDSEFRSLEHLLNEELSHLDQYTNRPNSNRIAFFVVGEADPDKESFLGGYPDYIYLDESRIQQDQNSPAVESYLNDLRAGINSRYFIAVGMNIHPCGD